MMAIFKREFKSYFTNVSGVLFISVLLLFTGIFTTAINLMGQFSAFEYALEEITLVFVLVVPVLCMRSLTEDKRMKTDSLLYALPLRLSSIVMGKYFAMLAVFLIPVIIMALYPLLLAGFSVGAVNFASAYASLLGFLLLGASLIALCMFVSSFTESQVIAAVGGFAVTLLLYFMNAISGMIPVTPLVSLGCFLVLAVLAALILYYLTKNLPISLACGGIFCALILLLYVWKRTLFEGSFSALLTYLAPFEKFYRFTYGVLDLKAVVFYLSFSAFFVFLTVKSLEKKRWS
ncbi:MAG: ABC transporter [Ruminococcaceae bacterium]|nr:ABC transporter [Oscillospiraceae bacterium]